MQFERNALSPTNVITQPKPTFHSSSNINALKFNLFQRNLNDNYVEAPSTTSSDEGNSPTELNNCRRILEKPPLVLLSFLLKVKRLAMGILRFTDDSRPLVHNKTSSNTSSDSIQTISDGYVNEAICDSEKLITNRFGDSCKQSFNRQTFQMHYPLSSINNAIPLTTLKRSSSETSSNIITTSATVHASEKSTNFNTCYNNASTNYNETNFCEFDYKKNFSSEPPSPTNGVNLIPPILPLRNDALSLTEQNDLKGAPWFQAGLPREISLEILSRQNPGAFLVRQSESKMGCFALSLRVPPPAPKVAHYLIMRTQRGFKIKGFTKEFSSLRALITHHSVMKELLPIPLNLPRQHEIQQRHELDDLDNLWFIK
ncbi:CLUMA_CG019489, isoform A [Clunio marinus]|uniref:CLUMA_CG019489, isoform A n=1 Tax=Clunio marinus TaxID=568069 RepID=A0A1J1J337_9DIPT|nr:CLUMA_CG019489, isoform A [Clunio marinus]